MHTLKKGPPIAVGLFSIFIILFLFLAWATTIAIRIQYTNFLIIKCFDGIVACLANNSSHFFSPFLYVVNA